MSVHKSHSAVRQPHITLPHKVYSITNYLTISLSLSHTHTFTHPQFCLNGHITIMRLPQYEEKKKEFIDTVVPDTHTKGYSE